ncbi:hypothetical protein [Pseudomonas sp.]|uniref:hypothetical protein n=1 Tax=Pseudomonas sp. TaxID=306 RepID=UPI00272F62B5|nr:hypothetical protein [Pseudomonas sp.]MDP2245668.1 hypothetical protein [Pseudomonas sp.]
MATQEELEVHRRLHESQDKHTYFLLAAVGACVGFSITQSNQVALGIQQLPLAIAVIMWGLSFYCGCRYLQTKQLITHANTEYLKAENGRHPSSGTEPAKIAVVMFAIRESINSSGTRASRYRTAQFYLFIFAVIFYVFWHVIKMWERTPIA